MSKDEFPELRTILDTYKQSFEEKEFGSENDEHDVLMDAFGITPELKRQNRQYWGRELGMCWQLIVSRLFQLKRTDWEAGLRDGRDEICDLRADGDAIDTKYRIVSGDAGTLKKFKDYAKRLKEKGYRPILLILRDDNLPNAIAACREGGWVIITGAEALKFVKEKTGVDLEEWLRSEAESHQIAPQDLEAVTPIDVSEQSGNSLG